MESLAKLREKVEQVLKSQITGYLMDELQETVIQSADLNRFLVVRTGWHNGTSHYALIQDVEIRKDKTVVIYADNTNTDLEADLTMAGVPPHKIRHSSSMAVDAQTKQGTHWQKQVRMCQSLAFSKTQKVAYEALHLSNYFCHNSI